MPEMTYTPSFLMRASFFRDFVNTLKARKERFSSLRAFLEGKSIPKIAIFLVDKFF